MLTKLVLNYIKRHPGKVLDFRDIVRALDVAADQRKALREVLDEFAAQDVVLKLKRGKYAIPARVLLVGGKLTCHPSGYGFVTPERESGLGEDIFIPAREMGDACHGDTVLVKVASKARKGNKLEGSLVKVVSRANERIVGRYFATAKGGYVIPCDERYLHEIRIAPPSAEIKKGLADGMFVDVEMVVPPSRHAAPLGKVLEIIGAPGDPDIDYKIVLYKHRIPKEFPAEVIKEAQSMPLAVGSKDRAGRKDFRKQLSVTIDGETARDFDDAVAVEKLKNGHYRLSVHIADVAHYVSEAGPLDREAYLRGTSVYFPDRAVPMLPTELSSGICSLNPHVDRLTVSVLMDIDETGEVVHRQFAHGVINSHVRMTYTTVSKILVDHDREEMEKHTALLESFQWMAELCGILNRKRRRRGAIDFDIPEPEVIFTASGAVANIKRSERNLAHRIIEEFMLLANETVAVYLFESKIPSLYRIHEEPDAAKTQQFAELARVFGYHLQGRPGKRGPADFQRLADQLSGGQDVQFLSYLMLRSFMLARYSDQNVGHFGLASETYTHFTSPIRRYPDLVVHRLLKEAIRKNPDRERVTAEVATLGEVAEHCSARERVAAAAEKEMLEIKRTEFMADKLGEQYRGFITRVQGYGFFVELSDPYVAGLVPVSTLLDDYYEFDEPRRRLIGKGRKKIFRIGDRLNVRVDRVDQNRHMIFFSVV
ncbi:MAG: ribonuclease R [Acidobacteria bacterium]|nr:ribonuclease R [Acidobacteriota bacterium]MBI3658183.1 ribonuclease R [Acidobacteriota bacterium]